ncbi:MAG TPA: hemerythrin domain-containing protein [Candidatus Acidoferrales bacterium]|nr:hemerythrin domain-containing protein [Candidatus Acidoferrales bacterium]
MPVQIGAVAHNFSDPTGLLSDCHRRIEMFLGSLGAVARAMDCPLTDETRRALDAALRYFREAAPKHTADEEESLFPRLRQVSNPEVQSALNSLEALENDHRWAASLHARVESLGQKYLFSGSLPSAEAEEFRTAVASLTAMYQQHIRMEDDVVFPAAARCLSSTERAAVADEMAARRKARLITEIPHLRERS